MRKVSFFDGFLLSEIWISQDFFAVFLYLEGGAQGEVVVLNVFLCSPLLGEDSHFG